MKTAKRFYKEAAAQPQDGGFAVALDGRTVKTPAGKPLVLPTHALAQEVAGEWNAQGDEINPKTMKLMPLAGTALDRVPNVREGLIEGLLRYADTDLLCYRAAHPEDLAQRQFEVWQPLLDWAGDALNARLAVTEGIVPIDQDPCAKDAFRGVLEEYDDFALTALGELVGITGSLIIGLALEKGHITLDQALTACHLDEDHQIERWGEDFEAKARRANLTEDLKAAYRFLELSRA